MQLQSISLTQFKNYSSAKFDFSKELNFLTGNNGAGKTNMLDAIHYLCLGKSYFHYSDLNAVNHGQNFFRIEGKFVNEIFTRVSCAFQTGNKKELQKDGIIYPRIADHVGLIPVVMIAPDDQLLIDEGSEERRRFIDNTISQIDHSYLEALISYNKVLSQRNTLLRQFAAGAPVNHSLIESYNDQLCHYGNIIFILREKYFERMQPVICFYYEMLSKKNETVSASYDSVCGRADLKAILQHSFLKDMDSQRTSEGIHRDDLDFFLNGKSLKKFASQGQKKSFLMALKLAQYELIRKEKNQPPLLLLDDLFDKLDKERSEAVLKLISGNGFGQVFITDTNEKRIFSFISETGKDCAHFHLQNGTVANHLTEAGLAAT